MSAVNEIHDLPCKNCPSAHFEPDPQALDIKQSWKRKDQIDSLFPCAWRPEKLCKGYCDFMGIL